MWFNFQCRHIFVTIMHSLFLALVINVLMFIFIMIIMLIPHIISMHILDYWNAGEI